MSSRTYVVILAVIFVSVTAGALICDIVVSHIHGSDSLRARIVHILAYWAIAVAGIITGTAIMAEVHRMSSGTIVSFVDWVHENAMLATMLACVIHILIMTPVNRFNRFTLGFTWLMNATFCACLQFIWNKTWLTLTACGCIAFLILCYKHRFDKPSTGTGNDIFDTIDDIRNGKSIRSPNSSDTTSTFSDR